MVDIDVDADLATAAAIAREAGAIIRRGYGRAGIVNFKGAIDLVTEYDRQSETFIRSELHRAFPGYAFIGEESTIEAADIGHAEKDVPTWVVDPLDGTTNYAHGFPMFCVSIALWRGAAPVLGVVYDPLREECFTATTGGGCKLNGEAVRVSQISDLGLALLATGFPYDIRTSPPEGTNLGNFANFSVRAQAVRRAGSAALDLAYVACGRFDGYWELKIHPWDVAAGILLVREAGGTVTDFDNGLAVVQPGGRVVASNGHIHSQMLDVLRLTDETPRSQPLRGV